MSQKPNGTSRAEGQSARAIDTTDAHEPHRRWPRDYRRSAAKTATVSATATTMSIRNDIGNRANHDFDRKPRSIETVSALDSVVYVRPVQREAPPGPVGLLVLNNACRQVRS